MAKVQARDLERWRSLDVSRVLGTLAEHAKQDPTFVPTKNDSSQRWHVSAGGREFEILTTGPKFFDTRQKRGGGGAVDLTMHLFAVDFKAAVAMLRERRL